jgi:CDGSH-type Zn-finger protein
VTNAAEEPVIEIRPNGPYAVTGASLIRIRPVRNEDGRPVAWERTEEIPTEDSYLLCRCGASATMPFCDGSEEGIGFDGSETADRGLSVDRRVAFGEEDLMLSDDVSLCSKAGFCTLMTTDAWELIHEVADPERRALLTTMVGNCPSGRLVLHDRATGAPLEEPLGAEIAAVQNGPLWVRGGVPVTGADGSTYEVRNRMTLCRCGQSGNKPFCDGSHTLVGFTDPKRPAD